MVKRLQKSERGVALLAVLLGIALMTLVVVDFAMTSGLGFVSAANQANELRASYLARSGINVGLGLLAADARAKQQEQTPAETLSDPWAVPFPPMPLGGGTVALSIVDEGRKINMNSMIQNNAPNLARDSEGAAAFHDARREPRLGSRYRRLDYAEQRQLAAASGITTWD